MEYRPLRIEPVHDQDPSPPPNPALEPLGEATKGLEFAILCRFGIGVRDIFAKFRRQGEREPIARDADRFQDIRSIPIGIHRPEHCLPRGFGSEWLVAHQCLGFVDRHPSAMIDSIAANRRFVENGGCPVFQKFFHTVVGDGAQEAFDAIKMGSGLDGGKPRSQHRGQ